MTERQVPALPVCQRCSAPVETDTDLCVQCLCEDLGITYRQLDHWSRMGYLRPVRLERGQGGGTGSPRVWPDGELQVARLMGRLTAASIPPSLAAVVARKWPAAQEIAPGVFVQIKEAAVPDEPDASPLTCGACRNSPATHLIVADLGGRKAVRGEQLNCRPCADFALRCARPGDLLRLYRLVPEGEKPDA